LRPYDRTVKHMVILKWKCSDRDSPVIGHMPTPMRREQAERIMANLAEVFGDYDYYIEEVGQVSA
jgi:hypothetical protein